MNDRSLDFQDILEINRKSLNLFSTKITYHL
jgi:hypothetical protein